MKFLTRLFEEDLEEGISKDGDGWNFDFKSDDESDTLSLKLKPYRGKTMTSGDMTYRYFNAFVIDKSDYSGDLMKAIKYLDSSIESNDLDTLVNKAILSLNKEFKINSFDTIITPRSTSMILKKLADKAYKKSGNSELFDEAFVKNANTDITYDKERVDKLPEKTKKEFLRSLERSKSIDSPFKIKSIFSRYRKLVKDFLVFNSTKDRKLFNAVEGKRILVIDDYKTTGSTIKEILKKLNDNGAKEVIIFVLMKVS
jgi:hypothetical protein